MTDLCAQAIENMECQPEPGRGVGRGRARVSRALGGGTPPLRQSRPEKPAQPFEKAQNRLGSGGRPKPRPGCAPGRSPCRLWSTRNAGWASPSGAGGRASRAAWAARRRPSDRAARKSRRKPLKRLKTGSGLAGGRSRDRVDRLAIFGQLETQAGRGRRVWEGARLARLGRRDAAPPTEPPGKAGATL